MRRFLLLVALVLIAVPWPAHGQSHSGPWKIGLLWDVKAIPPRLP
ncbi:MAG TPA: hypothetical protein VGW35_20900 [Methylomirabilota bacterium]|jgi:hypothetical protein|nr:hypothetical protein [Methylomirabilota bacterium]